MSDDGILVISLIEALPYDQRRDSVCKNTYVTLSKRQSVQSMDDLQRISPGT
jgi:hypothetical protein